MTWLDARNDRNHNPYVQRVLASGTVDAAWPVNGRALSLSAGEEIESSIVSDGVGGAIVAWEEDSFIFANHIEASGELDPTFPVNGRFLRLVQESFESHPDITTTGTGNAIVAWEDAAPNADSDIYAALVVTQETLAVDPAASARSITFSPPSPNPARGPVMFRFALPRSAAVRLAIYDVGGRRLRELVSGFRPAGAHDIAWDLKDESGRAVPAGLLFVRLDAEGQAFIEKIATVR